MFRGAEPAMRISPKGAERVVYLLVGGVLCGVALHQIHSNALRFLHHLQRKRLDLDVFPAQCPKRFLIAGIVPCKHA